MTKNKPDKEKNIDDLLSSIDSLLDTASDIEPDGINEHATKGASKTAAVHQSVKNPAPAEKSARSKLQPRSQAKAVQKKSMRNRKTAVSGQQLKARIKAETDTSIAAEAAPKISRSSTKARTSTPQDTSQDTQKNRHPAVRTKAAATPTPVRISKPQVDGEKTALKAGKAVDTKEKQPQEGSNAVLAVENNASGSLNFTTVDDDLSQVMRELPVLDDVITVEELEFIGCGKEPPKKILTEAFKRLSTSDKLIEILEHQLSDYNISKLEYKYLHELFDELLEKEINKK